MQIKLAVNGTLMKGLELNHNLLELGAVFVEETLTAPFYRLWSINDRHPAMQRCASGGNGTPRPRCSRRYQAAPIPSAARPPDKQSRVATILASRPGCRYVTPVIANCSSTVDVCAARKPRDVYPSSMGSVASPRNSSWK